MKQMKKLAVIAILGMLMTFPAKTARSQLFWLGFNGGLDVSWFTTPGIDNALVSAGAGYDLGFFLKYGKRPYYQVEFRWTRAINYIIYEYAPGDTVQGDVPFHQFEIPVWVGYNVVQRPMFKWHVNGGMSIGTVFLFSKNNFEFERNDFRNPQVALLAGTGIQFMNFIFDIDYSYHVNQLFKGDEEDLGVDFRSHLQMISVKFGLLF